MTPETAQNRPPETAPETAAGTWPAGAETLVARLRRSVPDKRFRHSLGVAEDARRFASIHGADTGKAWLAGLLHDCAKGIPTSEQVAECDRLGVELDPATRACPQVAHGFLGAFLARRDYGIDDAEILQAIRRHTVGGPNMTLLDKIVFLADGTEPGRHYPGADAVRAAAIRDLDEALRLFLDGQIAYLSSRGGGIHPSTLRFRRELG